MSQIKDMGVRISVSKTVEEAAQNEVPNMIHFTDGEVENGEHRILLNGKDYTGVKTVKESEKKGYINVDGTDVPVHGFDSTDLQHRVVSQAEYKALGENYERNVIYLIKTDRQEIEATGR